MSAAISPDAAEPLGAVRLGRAIGVIYLPATERQSHYFHVRPADQFDAMIHIDTDPGARTPRAHESVDRRRNTGNVSDRAITDSERCQRNMEASAEPDPSKAQIVTLTMNRVPDITTSVDTVRPTVKLRCEITRYEPGGGTAGDVVNRDLQSGRSEKLFALSAEPIRGSRLRLKLHRHRNHIRDEGRPMRGPMAPPQAVAPQ